MIRNVFHAALLQQSGDRLRRLSFLVFVGFGLAACAGSGGDGTEEPVAVDDSMSMEDGGVAEDMSGDMMGLDDMATDLNDPSADGADLGLTTPEPTAGEESLEGDALSSAGALADELTAAPPAVMEEDIVDAVDAELTPDGSDTSFASGSMPDDSGDSLFQSTTPAPMAGLSTGTTMSSPGAAANLPAYQASSTSASGSTGDQGVYVVQRGDTLSRIAKRVYGSVSAWSSLAAANGLRAPYIIRPGDALKFDLSNDAARTFADSYSKGRKLLTVKPGDTLSKIATQLYGSPHAWKVLFAYNQDKISNPNFIFAGMKLAYVDQKALSE